MTDTSWQNRVTLLVNSCDAYADLWQPFFTLLKRYFLPLPAEILLNTETKNFAFDGLNLRCVHSTAPTYGERMTDALREVKTEYTLLLLDDFFLAAARGYWRGLADIVRWMDADRDIVYFNSDVTAAVCDLEVDRYPGLPPPARRQPLHAEFAGCRLAHGQICRLLAAQGQPMGLGGALQCADRHPPAG